MRITQKRELVISEIIERVGTDKYVSLDDHNVIDEVCEKHHVNPDIIKMIMYGYSKIRKNEK